LTRYDVLVRNAAVPIVLCSGGLDQCIGSIADGLHFAVSPESVFAARTREDWPMQDLAIDFFVDIVISAERRSVYGQGSG